jgi:hypothetical protein
MEIGFALLLGFGMVLVIEGLAFALAPRRMEDLLRILCRNSRRNPPHDRPLGRGLRRDRPGARAGRTLSVSAPLGKSSVSFLSRACEAA